MSRPLLGLHAGSGASHDVVKAERHARRFGRARKEPPMPVAKVSEISSTSTKSFEDAIQSGLARAHKTIRNIRSAWIKEQQVRLEGGKIVEYQVNMLLTFVLED
jgi:flavin-binding protein dodecin